MREYQPSPRVVRKRKDVDRQQQRRDRMKATGTPTTHVLDRALVEGLMYQIDLQRVRGADVREMQISAQRVLAYATSILTAETNGSDRYNVESVSEVIRKRIGQPGSSKFRLAHITKEQRRAAALMSIEYAEDVED